jgi:ribosomal subunit interface protein
MEITVQSRHVEVPEDLRTLAGEKVARLGRYLEGMERAEIRFSAEHNPRISEPAVCEVTLHGHGHVVRAKASGVEPAAALERVVDKVAYRLTCLKKKLVGRSHPRRHDAPHNLPVTPGLPIESIEGLVGGTAAASQLGKPAGGGQRLAVDRGRRESAGSAAVASRAREDGAREDGAREDGAVGDGADSGAGERFPLEREIRIVRRKSFALESMAPEEAAVHMELASHDFFFFANAETDRPAVVYRRRDGDFGLIDPS